MANLSQRDSSDPSADLLRVSSEHRLSNLRWPCYLSDCVSEKWLPTDTCVQLWSGLGDNPIVQSLSYAEFQEFSDSLAAVLSNQWMKFKPHSIVKRIVGILWRPHILTSVAVHSVVKSGAAFYPVAYEFSADLSLLGDQLIAVICLSSSLPRAELFESFDAYSNDSEIFKQSDWCLFLRRPPNVHPPSSPCEIPNSPSSLLAYVITTSGSSGGFKKLVFVAHSCLTANIVDLRSRFGTPDAGQPEGRTVLLTAPLTFDPSLVQIYFALATHRCLVCPGPGILLHRDSLLSLCTEAKVQWLQCTPSLFMSQSSHAHAKLLSKRGLSIVLGGEPFPWLAIPRLQNAEAAVYSIYGVTEVSSWATICRVGRHNTVDRCGCPAPNPGSTPIGFPMFATELCLGAPITRHSYVLTVSRKFGGFAVFIMREGLITERQFIDIVGTLPSSDPWSTGDLVIRGRCEQCLWFVGRTDRMIKRYGQQICLEQLEMAIVQCSLPNAYVRFCKCDLFGNIGRQVLLAVVGVSPHPALKQSCPLYRRRKKFRSHIVNHVKRCFAPNYVPWLPNKIIFCGRTPSFSPHGKILRKPRNKGRLTVRYIWNRWAAAAGSPGLHLNYNTTFFEIGGSSLAALSLVETLVQQSPNLVTSKEKLLTLIFTSDFRSFVQHLLEDRDRTPTIVGRSSSNLLSEVEEADQLSSKTPKKSTQAITRGNILQTTLHSTEQLLLELQWTSHLGKCVDAPALIVRPTFGSTSSPVVCIGSHSGQLACFNLITGEKQWCADGSLVGGRIEAGAAYALSTSVEFVSVGTLSGKLCTFDLASGMLLWTFDTGGAIKSAPTNLHSRNLFVLGSHGRAIYAVDVRFPLQATWSNTFDNSPIVSEISSYDDSDTYLLATSLGGTVGCIDIRKPRELLWKSDGMAPIFTKATLSCLSTNERRAIISAVDGRMHSFDSLSGQLVWQSTMSLPGKQCQIFKDPLWDPHDQELLIGSNCGFLFGIEASTGTSKWVLDCRPNAIRNGPNQLNTPSIIYACTDTSATRRKMIVLSRADGTVIIGAYPSAAETSKDSYPLLTYTHYQLPNHSFSSPVICTEPNSNVVRLVIGCRDDNLYCLTLKQQEMYC